MASGSAASPDLDQEVEKGFGPWSLLDMSVHTYIVPNESLKLHINIGCDTVYIAILLPREIMLQKNLNYSLLLDVDDHIIGAHISVMNHVPFRKFMAVEADVMWKLENTLRYGPFHEEVVFKVDDFGDSGKDLQLDYWKGTLHQRVISLQEVVKACCGLETKGSYYEPRPHITLKQNPRFDVKETRISEYTRWCFVHDEWGTCWWDRLNNTKFYNVYSKDDAWSVWKCPRTTRFWEFNRLTSRWQWITDEQFLMREYGTKIYTV